MDSTEQDKPSYEFTGELTDEALDRAAGMGNFTGFSRESSIARGVKE